MPSPVHEEIEVVQADILKTGPHNLTSHSPANRRAWLWPADLGRW